MIGAHSIKQMKITKVNLTETLQKFSRNLYRPVTIVWVITPVVIASRLGLSDFLTPGNSAAINVFDMRAYGIALLIFLIGAILGKKINSGTLTKLSYSIGFSAYATLSYDVFPVLTAAVWYAICAVILIIESGRVRDGKRRNRK